MKIKSFSTSYTDRTGTVWDEAIYYPSSIEISPSGIKVTYSIYRNQTAFEKGVREGRERIEIKEDIELLDQMFNIVKEKIKNIKTKFKNSLEVEIEDRYL